MQVPTWASIGDSVTQTVCAILAEVGAIRDKISAAESTLTAHSFAKAAQAIHKFQGSKNAKAAKDLALDFASSHSTCWTSYAAPVVEGIRTP